jgi:hypothetical protein
MTAIRGFGFKCLHSHCTERHWKEFRAELQRRNPGLPPFFRGLPRMTHADIARDFIAENEDFCTVYNAPRSPIAAWVGTRWDVGDDGGRLLRKAVRAHLDALYHRYPEPEEGKRDYRLILLSAPFATNVLDGSAAFVASGAPRRIRLGRVRPGTAWCACCRLAHGKSSSDGAGRLHHETAIYVAPEDVADAALGQVP